MAKLKGSVEKLFCSYERELTNVFLWESKMSLNLSSFDKKGINENKVLIP